MSLSPATIDALIAAGATAEMLGAAMKAELAAAETARAAKRSANAERQRRKRARDAGDVTRDERDSALPAVTECDPSLPSFPPGPPKPTHPSVSISTRGKAVRPPSDFELWYEGYPHKVARGAAEKAFATALGLASLDELIAGRDRYIRDKPPDRSWCNPASWLNGRRWLDQPAAEQLRPAHERPSLQTAKFDARQANYERSLRGAQIAAADG